MNITRVGVDIAKNVFQVHGSDRSGRPVGKRQLRRGNWLKVLSEKLEPGCEIGMEAFAGAHSLGTAMRYVATKTVEQQDIQALHRVRSSVVGQRTAQANQIRGLVEGNRYLRSILIHGARSVMSQSYRKDDRLNLWSTKLKQRSHANVAAVALTNKTVGIAWAMLRYGADYQPELAVA